MKYSLYTVLNLVTVKKKIGKRSHSVSFLFYKASQLFAAGVRPTTCGQRTDNQ